MATTNFASNHPLLTLGHLPLILLIQLEGKAPRTFLSEILGLSSSRLRRSNQSKLRASTEQKAIHSARQWGRQRALRQGMSPDEFSAMEASFPSRLAGKPRPYADFIYGQQEPLPLTQAFGEDIDNLLDSLQASYLSNDLPSFQKILMEFDRWSAQIQPSETAAEKFLRRRQAVGMAKDWQRTFEAAAGIADDIIFCFFAALDVEHGATYFKVFRPLPLFPLLLPKLHPDFDPENPANTPKRNFIRRPARRLLEFSYAMMAWRRPRRWQKRPASRQELARALKLDEQHVGNLFDGTRNLTGTLFASLWEKLCRNVAKHEPFSLPLPLLIATVFWQSGLIAMQPNQKLKSVVLLDQDDYLSYWTWHRRRWASQLTNGSADWPKWFTD